MGDVSGPLFNGEAERLTTAMVADIERQVADMGEALVQANLASSLRNPTGFYQSRVQATAAGGDWEITDNGVVYGPWLEGVGSRNRTTRFKGYASFRRAARELSVRAGAIANRVAVQYVRRMG
jgi:hypothetical protein